MRILIRGGRVIDPGSNLDRIADVYIADGKVAAMDHLDGFHPDLEIDAVDRIVCPGLVDLCARLREPGQEPKADIQSETLAAAKSGITTLCVPPDTDPVIDTPAVAELVGRYAQRAGHARVVTLGAMTQGLKGERLAEMSALKEAGCVGITQVDFPIKNTSIYRRALDYAATHAMTVFIKPMDYWLTAGGCAHEGAVSARLGLPGIPESAETSVVARDLILIEQTGIRAHFCQLSSAKAVQMIGRAQYDGLPVTADVTAHHLHLTEMDLTDFNSQCHVLPPFRGQRDLEGLRQGVQSGIIGAICSDHQPHDEDAKLNPFCATEPGISGLETLLPLSLRLLEHGPISWLELIKRLTLLPAKILGLDVGSLEPGKTADVCIFDPNAYWRVDPATFVSRGHNTPFANWELKGVVTHTIYHGRPVYQRSTR